MEFEWDPAKSSENQIKHGVSFEEAMVIWSGNYLSVPEIAYSRDDEARDATLGLIGDKVYTAIVTRRKNKIRIISVRRARDHEEKVYRQSF